METEDFITRFCTAFNGAGSIDQGVGNLRNSWPAAGLPVVYFMTYVTNTSYVANFLFPDGSYGMAFFDLATGNCGGNGNLLDLPPGCSLSANLIVTRDYFVPGERGVWGALGTSPLNEPPVRQLAGKAKTSSQKSHKSSRQSIPGAKRCRECGF
jgi:hypothetical protein